MKSDQAEAARLSTTDKIKWGITWCLVAFGIAANYYYGSQPYPIRLTGWLLLMCIAGGVASTTDRGRKIRQLFREAQMEMRKVVWPTRQETLQTTGIVILMVVITAFILWIFDSILLWGVSFLTG